MITPAQLEAKALSVADKKMCLHPGGRILPHIGTGGGFQNIFLWDTAFSVMWGKYFPERFKVLDSLDNFYRFQDKDGFIGREYLPCGESLWTKYHPVSFAPTLLSWAELELYDAGVSGPDRIKKVFPKLAKQYEFCKKHFQQENGLYFCDPFGSGMDNLPRWPGRRPKPEGRIELTLDGIHASVRDNPYFKKTVGRPMFRWNRQGSWVDTSCQTAFNALNLARMAKLAGEDASYFKSEHAALKKAINKYMWSEEDSFYFDCTPAKGVTKRFFIASYWALIAKVVPESKADAYIAHLSDKKKFLGKLPFRSLAADDPDYKPKGGYWQGPVWAPTSYMVLRGLRAYGYDELAVKFAKQLHRGVAEVFENTGTFWENYNPDDTSKSPYHSQNEFCGWTALVPITIAREFLK